MHGVGPDAGNGRLGGGDGGHREEVGGEEDQIRRYHWRAGGRGQHAGAPPRRAHLPGRPGREAQRHRLHRAGVGGRGR